MGKRWMVAQARGEGRWEDGVVGETGRGWLPGWSHPRNL